jgi:hypothetical protein
MIELRTLPMRKSPFHQEIKNSKTKSVSFRLPIDAHDRLMKYFEANYDFNAKTKGLNDLCFKQLDMLCDERKTFNNLECFMLLPKYTNDPDKLSISSQIIAIVNTECDFRKGFNHQSPFNHDYKIDYTLSDFNFENFPMEIIANTKDSCVYRTNIKDLNSFYTFKDRQSQLYYDYRFNQNEDLPNLNVEDCYFVRFPLNNYLDVYRNGQYQKDNFNDFHEGIYAFYDLEAHSYLYCIIEWSYSLEMDLITFDLHFVKHDDVIQKIYDAKDEKLNETFFNLPYTKDRMQKEIKEMISMLEENLSYYKSLLHDNCPDDD